MGGGGAGKGNESHSIAQYSEGTCVESRGSFAAIVWLDLAESPLDVSKNAA